MDFRFDSEKAYALLQQMNKYCNRIQRNAMELMAILQDSGLWDDYQHDSFKENIKEITGDLNNILRSESQYMKTLYERIQELRG